MNDRVCANARVSTFCFNFYFISVFIVLSLLLLFLVGSKWPIKKLCRIFVSKRMTQISTKCLSTHIHIRSDILSSDSFLFVSSQHTLTHRQYNVVVAGAYETVVGHRHVCSAVIQFMFVDKRSKMRLKWRENIFSFRETSRVME